LKAVLDASALLAFLQSEPGSEEVEAVLAEAFISAVNWSEVVQKALSANVETSGMRADVQALGLTIEAFTAEHAEFAGQLWSDTKKYGLSLGDRACLSLGHHLELPILTMDRAWIKPALSLDVRVLR
jgi:PIN domain nuclease of toxin-antitoxin system